MPGGAKPPTFLYLLSNLNFPQPRHSSPATGRNTLLSGYLERGGIGYHGDPFPLDLPLRDEGLNQSENGSVLDLK